MKSRRTPASPRWSGSCPAIVIEAAPARRVALGWQAWCLSLAVACAWGTALPLGLRVAAAGLAVAAAAAGRAALLGGRGRIRGPGGGIGRALWPGAIVGAEPAWRLEWRADGRWWFAAGDEGHYVEMRRLVALGPLLWLAWSGPGGRGWSCLERQAMEPVAWRRLKGRMKLQRSTLAGGQS